MTHYDHLNTRELNQRLEANYELYWNAVDLIGSLTVERAELMNELQRKHQDGIQPPELG